MTLLECPECNGQVSNQARACPHCGLPLNASTTGPLVATQTVGAEDPAEEVESTDDEHTEIEIKDESGAVLARVKGTSLRGANLAGQHLWNAQLRGQDLREANLRGADLRSANLRDCDLRGAKLDEANFDNAFLDGANLCALEFDRCQRKMSFVEAHLKGVDLRNARWAGVNCQRAKLNRSDLESVRFESINFYGVDLHGANLDKSDFSHCNLEFADVRGTDLSRLASTRYCKLTRMSFDRTTTWPFPPLLALRTVGTEGLGVTALVGAIVGVIIALVWMNNSGVAEILGWKEAVPLGLTGAIVGGVLSAGIRGGFRIVTYLAPRFLF